MQRVASANFWADAFGAGKNGYQDYNPATGTPGTLLSAPAQNALQEEIASFIESQGIALNPADNTQLRQAMAVYIAAQSTGFETVAASASELAAAIAGLETPSEVASAISAALTAYAPKANPVFTGSAQGPTPGANDNSTNLATTAWVQALFSGTLSANGLIKIPSGTPGQPLIIQWCSVSASFSSGHGPASLSWPINFPTACFFALPSAGGTNTGGGGLGSSVTATSVSGATVMMECFNPSFGSSAGATALIIGFGK